MAEESTPAARRVRSRSHGGSDRRLKGKGDKISGLPDVILQHIFAYIPTKYAIRTSLLSKRWRNVWCDTRSLSFNSSILKDAWINQTPTGYTAPRMLHFHLKSDKNHDVPHIDKWLELVMSRHVENMVLSFWLDEYSFPDFFYVNSSLKQLTLKELKMSPKCSVSWTSLKKLSLVRCSVSDESMDNILSGCPILESLTLTRCNKLSYLDLSKSPRLRTLAVERSSWNTGPKHIEAPHIHYLYLRYSWFPCTLVDVSSLTEADVNFCVSTNMNGKETSLQDKVMNMLVKLRHVEKLTFGTNLLQVLSFVELRGVPFPMFKVKSLKFKTRIFHYVILGVKRVLQNSHDLKKLTLHTNNCSIKLVKHLDNCLALQSFSPAQLCERSKVAGHWDVQSKHLAMFVELVLQNTETLDQMFLVLDDRYRKFKKIFENFLTTTKSPLPFQIRLVVNHRV